MPSLVWDNFTVGEFGSLDPRKAPNGSWTGVNVVRYVDGSVGPRCGFERATTIADGGATLGLLGIGTSQRQLAGSSERDVFVAMFSTATKKIYAYNSLDDADKGFLTPTGTLDVGNAQADFPDFLRSATTTDRRGYFGGLDQIRVDETAAVEITAPPITVGSIAQHGDRVLGGYGLTTPPGATPNRVHYTDPNAPETWPALNFFDVGADSFQIVDLLGQRSHVVISKLDGSWHIVTGQGDLARVGTQRLVTSGEPRQANQKALGLVNGEVWYISGTNYCPVVFDGSQLIPILNLRLFDSGTLVSTGAPLSQVGEMIWLASIGTGADQRKLLLRRNGAWSFHTENTPTVIERIATLAGDVVVGVGEITSDTEIPIFMANFGLERPPFRAGATGSTRWEDDRDDANSTMFAASFRPPDEWSKDGSEIEVRAVTVDFVKYTTGSTFTNHFDVTVSALGRFNGGNIASAAQSFDEANTGGTSGTDESRTFYFGTQGPGRGFRVELSNLRGVKIRAIQPHWTTAPPRI